MQFDLIIVGGGLVGAGLAVALRDSGLCLALVDARLPSSDDARLFALNETSCQFLKNLNLWKTLAPHAAPIHQVHVSHQGHFASVCLDRKDIHAIALGHVIPAHFIESSLNEMLLSLPNVTLFRPATLRALQQHEGQAQLTVKTKEGEVMLHAPMVIGADGADSTVRTEAGIPIQCFDYKQSAIVTRTTLKRSHQHIAYERFNKQGAIAMLPLIGNECATIWSADQDTVSHLMGLSEQGFLDALQQAFGYRLGRLQKISQRHVYPLRKMCAQKAVEGSVLLLGNAAHTLHPIAAQGFNLALYEVAVLVQGLAEKKSLSELGEQLQQQQATSIGISHRLATLFSHDAKLMQVLLTLGMIGFDKMEPIKKRFIQGAMGTLGRVPRLLLSTNSYDYIIES
jgi:2-octaprenyl-6-methoxyphenol hydroxylase